MKAILLKEYGDSSNLYLGEVAAPQPKDDEVLVKIKATALNRADILQRQGKYLPPPGASTILGLECAGEVETSKGRWKKGDRVMGLLGGGGYAEYVAVSTEHLMAIPENLSYQDAAGIPEVFLTAYQSLFWHGEIKPGDSVLIHAGASGVGTAAIQLCRIAAAGKIIVTAGTREKVHACLKLGATHGVNYKEADFSKEVEKITERQGVNIILDFIGAPYWEKNLSSLAPDGRLVLIATMGGGVVEKANLAQLFQKRVKITATTLRPRSNEYKAKLIKEFSLFALPLFKSGALKPVISKVLSWNEAGAAHQAIERNENIGKIVLLVD